MASIRKRTRLRKNGKEAVYWQVSYYDTVGGRHFKQFKKQAQAHAFKVKIESELYDGSHISDKDSVTMGGASLSFLQDFERSVKTGARERSTLKQYKSHVKNHINPAPIAQVLLNYLHSGDCRDFVNHLADKGISDTQAAKIMTTLRMIIGFSEEKRWIKGNPARAVKVKRQERAVSTIEIPPKEHVRALLQAAEAAGPRQYAFACLGFFCGLRVSEIRGFPKTGMLADRTRIKINQRADEWGKLGPPKTKKSNREIPMGKITAAAVKAWADQATHDLLFADERGGPESYASLYNRFLMPLHEAAGLYDRKTDKGITYGFHHMRHVAASLWIEQGRKPKKVQELLGHATLKMTMDIYGHLWPDDEADDEMANLAENSILVTEKQEN